MSRLDTLWEVRIKIGKGFNKKKNVKKNETWSRFKEKPKIERVDGLIDILYAATFQPELCIGPDRINHPYFTDWQKVVIVFQRVDPIWSDRSGFSEQLANCQFK